MNVDNLRALVADDAACAARIKELRASFSPYMSYVALARTNMTLAQAFERGTRVIQDILRYLKSQRFDVRLLKPGHSIGHMARNYVHAQLLLHELDEDPENIFIGLITGTLHDLGCLFVNRMEEWGRATKHAEIGAIVFGALCSHETFGLSAAERLTIQYAVAAHTNFQKPQMVLCRDNALRRSDIYRGVYFYDGRPYMAIHLPRFVDRLDLTHPLYIGRMLLEEATRFADPYEERDTFIEFMRIGGERHTRRTNLQALSDFVQSNLPGSASPYVQHDSEPMARIRVAYNNEMHAMVNAVATRAGYGGDESALRCSLVDFLEQNLEPTALGRAATAKLFLLLNELSPSTHNAWCAGFAALLESYHRWGAAVAEKLEMLPAAWRELPGVCDDVREIIAPHYEWPPKITGA